MDTIEAHDVLSKRLAGFTRKGYPHLAKLAAASTVESYEVEASSGNCYQVEVQIFWDDQSGGDIRIIGSIDDGGLRAFAPLTRSELIPKPEGVLQ